MGETESAFTARCRTVVDGTIDEEDLADDGDLDLEPEPEPRDY